MLSGWVDVGVERFALSKKILPVRKLQMGIFRSSGRDLNYPMEFKISISLKYNHYKKYLGRAALKRHFPIF